MLPMNPNPTASLFDDDQSQGLSLTRALARSRPETKAQQTFQRLVTKIESRREQLRQWQAYLERYNQRVAGEYQPLRQQLLAAQRQMAFLIDELLSQTAAAKRLKGQQRAKLIDLLRNLIGSLLGDADDDALVALHDKYSEVPHRQMRESEIEVTAELIKDMLGLEVDAELAAGDPEELLRQAQKLMEERVEDDARQAEAWHNQRAARRSKAGAAKAQAAQARREKAAQEVSLSLREVYRKLVSALHPDREPDAAARKRKTELMQRVNQAYDANDLLTLLALQLEIEQIDAAHLANVTPQRLAHYVQILREQLAELEAELAHCIEPFRDKVGWGPQIVPATVDRQMNNEMAALRAHIRELQRDLVAFRDPAALRDILKHYRLEAPDDDADELFGIMELFAAAAPSRGRRKRRGA